MQVHRYTDSSINPQRRFKVAAVQMDSGMGFEANRSHALATVDEAAAHGAQVVCFPEHAGRIELGTRGRAHGLAGDDPDPWVSALAEKAAEHRIHIHCGSVFEHVGGSTRPRNTSVLLAPDGTIAAAYAKLHVFDVTLPDGTVCWESATTLPGDEMVVCDTAFGTWGLAICYDMRFPELFRTLALAGAQVLFCPANFTKPTGKLHWEVLLRARAIENGCYVIACNQCGTKPEFEAYGNSLIIDPMGTVLARAADSPAIIYAEIDLDAVDDAQAKLGSLANRRPDVYGT